LERLSARLGLRPNRNDLRIISGIISGIISESSPDHLRIISGVISESSPEGVEEVVVRRGALSMLFAKGVIYCEEPTCKA